MRQHVVELRAAEMDREHATAHEVAHGAAFARVIDAQRFAGRAAAAVGTDRIGGAQRFAFAAVGLFRIDLDAMADVADGGHPPARAQRDGRAGGGLFAQHALDENLRHAMRQLGRAPGAGQRLHHVPRRARRRQAEARKLVFGVAGEIGDVGRIIRRQSLGAHLLGETEPPVVLHRPRLGCVGRGKLRRRCAFLEQDRRDAATAQFDGKREAARASANDDDVAVLLLAHAIPRQLCRAL
jgi:hypothetical protein